MSRVRVLRGSLGLAGVGLCFCAVTLACGSVAPQVPSTPLPSPPAPSAETPLDPPGVSVHAVWEKNGGLPTAVQLLSFQIDATGRPRLTGTLDIEASVQVDRLAADPRGRFVYLATAQHVSTYAFDPIKGRLTEIGTAANVSQTPDIAMSRFEQHPDALTAGARYLYLTCHFREGSRSVYQLTTFAVADDGRLRLVDGQLLGNDLVAGPHVVLSQDEQNVFLFAHGDFYEGMLMLANAVDSRGHLVEKARLRFPDTRDERYFFRVGSVLVAVLGREEEGDDALVTVGFDRHANALELLGLIPSPVPRDLRAFGGDGFLALSPGVIERYTVSSTGGVASAEIVPDPNGFYSQDRLEAFYSIQFHPSWRFGYYVRATTIRAFGVATSGQLTLVDEAPLPAGHIPSIPRSVVVLGRQ